MSDIRKIRETQEKDGNDWDDWPEPDLTIESVVSGDLRARILQVLELADDGAEVHLIETRVQAGSEFTPEDDCEITVTIGGAVAWKDDANYSTESAMAKFLAKFGGTP